MAPAEPVPETPWFAGALMSDGLADMPPGPVLASLDRSALSGHSSVLLVGARARQVAHEQAQLYADMVAVSEHVRAVTAGKPQVWSSQIPEFAADEIRCELHWTRRAAEFELDSAYAVVKGLPRVWAAQYAGRIDQRRAKVFVEETRSLSTELARSVAEVVLPEAGRLTTGQLATKLRRLVLELDPAAAERRYEQGVADRKVVHGSNPDGTAFLSGCNLPASTAARAAAGLDELARSARRAGDPRSIDQLRADLYLALLTGDDDPALDSTPPAPDAVHEANVGADETPDDIRSRDPRTEPSDPFGGDAPIEEAEFLGPDALTDPPIAGKLPELYEPYEPAPPQDPADLDDVSAVVDPPELAEPPYARSAESSTTGDRCVRGSIGTGDNAEFGGGIIGGGFRAVPSDLASFREEATAEGDSAASETDLSSHAAGPGACEHGPSSRPSRSQRRGVGGRLELVVDLKSLLGLADRAGELAGWGPVVADVARQIAADMHNAQWRYTVTDPYTGTVMAHGITRRRPGAQDKAFIIARDRTCRAPGCRMPASQSDQDHVVDHGDGGATTLRNLGSKCRHDHRLKHEGGWQVTQDPDGVTTWTSRLGRLHTVQPEALTEARNLTPAEKHLHKILRCRM
jgi:hypothetical protein